MSIHFEGKKVREMYWAGRKVKEAWYGGERVFSGKPVEVMPPISGGGWGARDWLRSKLEEYGENYQKVTEIPFEIDTGEATSMRGMFQGCSSLTTVPDMDTRQVTNMSYMFYGCSSLTTVPDMDTHQVTNMSSMFSGCSSLTDGNVRLIGKHPQVSTSSMIFQSGLTRRPFYDINGQPI